MGGNTNVSTTDPAPELVPDPQPEPTPEPEPATDPPPADTDDGEDKWKAMARCVDDSRIFQRNPS